MKIFVINGPNINMLGVREPEIYGSNTYNSLVDMIKKYCDEKHIDVEIFQSNHEGSLVDIIQSSYKKADGIIINPGAYTHTSIAILDALLSVGIPSVEVHISDVTLREDFRQISYVRKACEKTFMGLGIDGYLRAIDYLTENRGV